MYLVIGFKKISNYTSLVAGVGHVFGEREIGLGQRLEAELKLEVVCWEYFGFAVEVLIVCLPLVGELFIGASCIVFRLVAVVLVGWIIERVKSVINGG